MRALPRPVKGKVAETVISRQVRSASPRREKFLDVLFALKRLFDFSRLGRARFRGQRNELWDDYYLARMFIGLGHVQNAEERLDRAKRALERLVSRNPHMALVNRLCYSTLRMRMERMQLDLDGKLNKPLNGRDSQ